MTKARYFSNQLEAGGEQLPLEAALPDVINHLVSRTESGDDLDGGGVYVGLTGVSLALWHVSRAMAPADSPLSSALLQAGWDEASLVDRAVHLCEACVYNEALRPHSKRVTFLEGCAGPLTLLAVLQHHREQQHQRAADATARATGSPSWRDTLAHLVALRQTVARLPASECEVLYGRSGYLWALIFARQHLPAGSVPTSLMQEVVCAVLEEGAAGAQRHGWPGLMFQWHDSLYLGAAHGLCGVLHVLLMVMDLVEACDPPGAPGLQRQRVLQAVQSLVDACHPSGNLPSSVGSTTDKLVQWCHGAPGLLMLMPPAMTVFPQHCAHWLPAVRKSANVVWERGLLCKGLGVCHGISGNAYALLAAGRALAIGGAGGEEVDQQLRRARLMAGFGVLQLQSLYAVPDRPASLYEGLAGQACLMADLSRPHDPLGQALCPGYELPLPATQVPEA